ncbi:hypothetical protein HanHA300_Chr01g0009171 [Helianthus annuus]|nr:hypothetical protein HanHA300_Chr01g0009171 [Helianthus annuus]KAJ0626164.1 hypothetical protein HanHA89_Chr01g0009961 [Helianthus annuus]KAJ0782497.1 hypothetical protein HanLR1_Chr01g0008911 [Helianthus annuus]
MRPIISPNQILTTSTKRHRSTVPMPIRQLLIILLQHLLSQLRCIHNNIQLRIQVHREYWAVGSGPFSVAPELDWFNVVEVADDGEGAWARWEFEPETGVEGLEEVEYDGGDDGDGGGEEEWCGHGEIPVVVVRWVGCEGG